MGYASKLEGENVAKAMGRNLSVSTKQAIEICSFLRNKKLQAAKKVLQEVIAKRKAIPYRRFNSDTGHRKGMGPGRYPVSASTQMLKLIESAEANAQYRGLNTSNLSIVHICAHKAAGQWHYGRKRRRQMKRSHIEVILKETAAKSPLKKEKVKEKGPVIQTRKPAEKESPKKDPSDDRQKKDSTPKKDDKAGPKKPVKKVKKVKKKSGDKK